MEKTEKTEKTDWEQVSSGAFLVLVLGGLAVYFISSEAAFKASVEALPKTTDKTRIVCLEEKNTALEIPDIQTGKEKSRLKLPAVYYYNMKTQIAAKLVPMDEKRTMNLISGNKEETASLEQPKNLEEMPVSFAALPNTGNDGFNKSKVRQIAAKKICNFKNAPRL